MKIQDVVIDGAVLYLTTEQITDPKTQMTSLKNDYLGCAKSSITVVAKPRIRDIEFMGKKENMVKNTRRITGWEVSCEADILDLNTKTLSASLMDKSTNENFDIYTPKKSIDDNCYKNLVIVGTLEGEVEPIVLVVNNTFNEEGINVDFKDNDESAVKMKFNGHIDMETEKVPYQIFRPKEN